MTMNRRSQSQGLFSSSPVIISAFRLLIVTTLVFTPALAHANASSIQCELAEDLDFDVCKPENLPIPELQAICESVGLNIEDDVFPHIFHDSDGAMIQKNVHTHADYIKAAYECIVVADETAHHHDEEMLEEHPELMADIVSSVMEDNPHLVGHLVMELQKDDPAVWGSIAADLAAGQTLLEKPELISELVKAMIEQDLISIDFDEDDDDDDEYDEDDVYDDDEL